MPLRTSQIHGLCQLARVRLTPEEEQRLVPQLHKIVTFFDRLRDVGIPERWVRPEVSGDRTQWRQDRVEPSMSQAGAVANAPRTDGRLFLVPRVLG